MTATRSAADRFFARQSELDPVRAALSGAPVDPGALPDYSPAGFAARAELLRSTDPGGDPALAERLAAETAHTEAGLVTELNLVTCPPVLLREHLGQLARDGDPAVHAEALAGVPAALRGYAETLRATALPPARRQVEMVLGAVGSWAAGTEFGDSPQAEAARRGYAELAAVLTEEVLPTARPEDGVGVDRYRAAARFHLGEDLDPAHCHEVLVAELDELRAASAALAPRGVRETCAELNTDPRWTATGPETLRDWAVERLDTAASMGREVLVAPPGLGAVQVHVPVEQGSPRYLPPAADGSRPARLVWPVPAADPVPVWNQTTMLHHEGVPGHHLQLGTAVLTATSAWAAHTVVAGNAEGWAVYAEGLMRDAGALTTPQERLGHVLGLRLNVAMALVDLSVHTGLPMGDTGGPWTLDGAAVFLAAESAFDAGSLYFTVLRSAAWPGQALTYAWGARVWQELRAASDAKGIDPREFHRRMLALGPCGLSVLRSALGA